MSDDFDELSPKAFLTRRQLVRFLNQRGFSISFSSIAKYCAPARGEGPPTAGVWARHRLYDREEALEWARKRLRSGLGRRR
jgi:hypothetical protein